MTIDELLETTETSVAAETAITEKDDVPHYEFDLDFQQKIVAMALRDTPFAQLTEGLIRPQFFENAGHAALIRIASTYFAKYKKAPGDKVTIKRLLVNAYNDKIMPKEIASLAAAVINDILETDVSDRDYVADQCAMFARHQAVSSAILESVDLISKRDFEGVSTKIRTALDTGVHFEGTTYDYAEMSAVRTQLRKDRLAGISPATGITTGYPVLDGYFYHKGWGRKELSVLMGGAKAGKSMAMIGFAINACANGFRTLYVTLEVAQEIIAERIDANIADRAMSELAEHPYAVEEAVKKFAEKSAPLMIKEFPTGTMRASDLRRLIEHYKSRGIVFDLVVVDYADLMAPERATDNVQENSKSIYANLRGIAMQEGFAILTATQTNRDGAKKAVATMTDVAEDFNKIRIADVVLSINATDEERAAKQARLFFAACRNQRSGFSLKIQQSIDCGKFITKVLGED